MKRRDLIKKFKSAGYVLDRTNLKGCGAITVTQLSI